MKSMESYSKLLTTSSVPAIFQMIPIHRHLCSQYLSAYLLSCDNCSMYLIECLWHWTNSFVCRSAGGNQDLAHGALPLSYTISSAGEFVSVNFTYRIMNNIWNKATYKMIAITIIIILLFLLLYFSLYLPILVKTKQQNNSLKMQNIQMNQKNYSYNPRVVNWITVRF